MKKNSLISKDGVSYLIPSDGEGVLENLPYERIRGYARASGFLWRLLRHGISCGYLYQEVFL